MRLLILSDLHVEYADLTPPPCDDVEVVVLAGDIGQATLALHWARRSFPDRPIVQIAGNHEFFDARIGPALAAMRATARRLGIHFLEQDAVVLGDVEFLGCTLWTDYRYGEAPGRRPQQDAEAAMKGAHRVMLDYRCIETHDPQSADTVRAFRPEDSAALHETARHWLAAKLAEPRRTRARVVVTHHLPSGHSVSPDYAAAPSNPAFVSNLDELLVGADLWVHGHTHSSHDYFASGCRVVCNPRGYPMRTGGFENPRFRIAHRIEV